MEKAEVQKEKVVEEAPKQQRKRKLSYNERVNGKRLKIQLPNLKKN